MENKKPNRLIQSLSPYLRQHAYNPVDWYEWGPEAFARAESENKLMLVSIGYSACHWCHVMAHESFEDPETAALMNRLFVCIKIDREELPDIDHLYMDACQLINGNGGWPLNAFALPDKRPLHALTYAPKARWMQLLESLGNMWVNHPSTAYEYAEKLSHGIRNLSLPPELLPDQQSIRCSDHAMEAFNGYYDPVFGGSKRAPKFPMPSNWRFLLQYGHIKPSAEASSMALHTLEQMALGGIYDPVGGGFARYSVDEKWFAPHFEKMLYDNAQLLGVYSYAFALSGDAQFRHAALQTAAFCKNQWLTPEGVYQSALDADSDGTEGYYYTYTYRELESLLGNDTDVFAAYYQCTEAGNWEHGRNILYASGKPEEAARQLHMPLAQLEALTERCLHTLLTYRSTRTAPGTDDKCICSWNALLLKSLAEASVYLQTPELLNEAKQLAEAMLRMFETPAGLMRISKDGTLKIDAYLEDYATLTDAFITLYRCTLDEHYLHTARAFCSQTIDLFYRKPTGFFAFSSKPAAIAEKFDTADDVIPSGNSIMAHNLYTLSWYYNLPDWKHMAETMCLAMQELIKTSAPWYSNWAALALRLENSCMQYVYSGPSVSIFANEAGSKYTHPDVLLGYVGASTEIPLFKGKEYNGRNRLFKCIDMQCLQPVEL